MKDKDQASFFSMSVALTLVTDCRQTVKGISLNSFKRLFDDKLGDLFYRVKYRFIITILVLCYGYLGRYQIAICIARAWFLSF